MSEGDRDRYKQMSEQDRQRYEREIECWRNGEMIESK